MVEFTLSLQHADTSEDNSVACAALPQDLGNVLYSGPVPSLYFINNCKHAHFLVLFCNFFYLVVCCLL